MSAGTKMKIKKGDIVQMLAGKDRGKQGRVVQAQPARGQGHRREPERRAPAARSRSRCATRAAWAASR